MVNQRKLTDSIGKWSLTERKDRRPTSSLNEHTYTSPSVDVLLTKFGSKDNLFNDWYLQIYPYNVYLTLWILTSPRGPDIL